MNSKFMWLAAVVIGIAVVVYFYNKKDEAKAA